MSHKRPESTLPAHLTRLTDRALELLALSDDESHLLLDIGCGSGLSGETISENGHNWIGIDISTNMLAVATQREVDGDLILGDIGFGLPFRGGSFSGAISISAIQWLCNADTSFQDPVKRIRNFFTSLYSCLDRNARAVLQFYPESITQADLLQSEATRAGFSGGLIVDYPNSTRAKKYFLILDVCRSRILPQPVVDNTSNQNSIIKGRLDNWRQCREMKKLPKNSIAWIKSKKERARKQMKEVASDSKYTGRRRHLRF